MRRSGFLVLSVLFLLSACSEMTSNSIEKIKNIGFDVIYGEDDRKDFFQVEDPQWIEMAKATVALIDKDDLSPNGEFYNLLYQVYGEAFNLCKDENFYDQPSVAFCSGFLIGPDVVVTAGHCIRNQYNCEDVRLAFDFSYDSPMSDPVTLHKSKIYRCKEVIHTQANGVSGSDFAILRLDRKVPDRKPLLIRHQGKIATGEALGVIGYPSGIPVKVAFGGVVRKNTAAAHFITNLDTYGGNSGSAVINADTRLVEGILYNGDKDFHYSQTDKCWRSQVCDPEGCTGEGVVRISEIYNYITPSDLQ